MITSDLEHNSVSRPLRKLEKDGVISLTRVASHDGYLDPAEIRAALRPETALVALTHASNVLGTVQPIEEIAAIVREADALFLVDAAQSAGVVPIDLKTTPIDLLAFPGHKALYGPTGTGALYVGPRAKPRAWREGGTGGDSKTEVQPDLMPYFLEGGTPNVLGIAGLAAGIAWVAERGVEANRLHEVHLLQKVVDGVNGSPDGWKVAGRWDPATHVGALSLIPPDPDVFASQDVAMILDTSFGIAVRAGLHCSPYAHRRIGTFPDGTVRLSPARSTPRRRSRRCSRPSARSARGSYDRGASRMKITITCPRCGQKYDVAASLAGRRVRCKECFEDIRVPIPSPEAARRVAPAPSPAPAPAVDLDDEEELADAPPPPSLAAIRKAEPGRGAKLWGPLLVLATVAAAGALLVWTGAIPLGPGARPGAEAAPATAAVPEFEAERTRLAQRLGDRGVTLAIFGLPDLDDPADSPRRQAIDAALLEKVRELAPGGEVAGGGSGSSRTFTIGPVADAGELRASIRFGKATRRGSRIEIEIDPKLLGEIDPGGAVGEPRP